MSPELKVFVEALLAHIDYAERHCSLDWGSLRSAIDEAAHRVEWERAHGSLRDGDI